ncbi:unnamed protein product [Lepeophtheirus salmonis]|uniref:(salmon louse) hypothetical protein n=1 Tax=Lepeophtheirus salmonis TaxID=72036 RepID=A0A7R8HE95_LEPSM|nr:unnamed protein product [Lepeophtheirus salmonis]CAF3025384.1 unnamed protein product [Lepeophtheirus salmonis]
MILGGNINIQLFVLCFQILFGVQSKTDKGFYRMTSILGYRNDGRCGPNHRLRHGAPSHCSVNGASPCCSYQKESCGIGEEYCECDGCTDFRTFNLAQRDVSIHLRRNERFFIISHLTKHLNINNWATIDHIQYSKKTSQTRINYILIIRESHCSKTQPLELDHCQLKNCIRAKVYEGKPRAQKLRPQMKKKVITPRVPKVSPHKDYQDVAHIELKIAPSICQRNKHFFLGCSGILNGEVKSCSVDVRVSVEKNYRLIHFNCDAICGTRSSNNFEDQSWTHWSKGLCHQGVLSRIRFCYDHLSRKPAFDCEGMDIKLTDRISGDSKVNAVEIKGCGKGSSGECKVKSNEKVRVIFKMKAGVKAKNITLVLSGVIGDIRLPMPNTKVKDLCGEIKKGSCPLEKDTDFTHELKLKIPMKVIAEVKYVNEDKKTIACAQIPTQVY